MSSIANEIRRSVSIRLKQLLRRSTPRLPTEGVPLGVTLDALHAVSHQIISRGPARVSHLHLSGWKTTGAYRLFLEAEDGAKGSVIFKNALYDFDQIPALREFPVLPGHSEFSIYSHNLQAELDFVPRAFHIHQIESRRHYQYYLEDLATHHSRLSRYTDYLQVARQLPDLYQAMALLLQQEVAPDVNPAFLSFDQQFSAFLVAYVEESLPKYFSIAGGEVLEVFLSLWPKIARLHQKNEFHEMYTPCLIHGDLNHTNIWLRRGGRLQLKLVDWEWAGYGYPHADLVSLLKFAPPDIEWRALKAYSQVDRQLSFDGHRRLYNWCKLERGLLDASFMASQAIGADSQPRIDLSGYVRFSLKAALRAYSKLEGKDE